MPDMLAAPTDQSEPELPAYPKTSDLGNYLTSGRLHSIIVCVAISNVWCALNILAHCLS